MGKADTLLTIDSAPAILTPQEEDDWMTQEGIGA